MAVPPCAHPQPRPADELGRIAPGSEDRLPVQAGDPTFADLGAVVTGGMRESWAAIRTLYRPVVVPGGLVVLVALAVTAFAHGASRPVAALVLGILGIPVGSWLASVASRPPFLDATVIVPLDLAWRCDSCAAPVQGVAAWPIIGWFAVRGRGRCCGARIGWWEPTTEVLTPAVFALVGWRLGLAGAVPAHLVLAAVAVVVALIDLRLHRIPTRIVYPATALSVVLFGVGALIDEAHGLDGSLSRLGKAMACGVVTSLIFWMLRFVYPAGMGDGDARLALLLGVHLGWYGVVSTYLGIFAGFMLGAVLGLVLAVATLPSRRRAAAASGERLGRFTFAFGPYLVVGALLVILWPNIFPMLRA